MLKKIKELLPSKNEDEQKKKKNLKLTKDSIRLRIFRSQNGTPVEIRVIDAIIKRDKYGNPVIFDEENNIKEEMPGIYDDFVKDVISKIESRSKNKEQQLKDTEKSIIELEKKIKSEKNGKIKDSKVNIKSLNSKLNLLKVVKYSIKNLNGDGYYETIESDGMRSLSYILLNDEIMPYFHLMPEHEGQPVVLVPNIAQRKKIYKENNQEALNDFNDNNNTMWRGVLGIIAQLFMVIILVVGVGYNVYLMKYSKDLSEQDLTNELNELKLQLATAKQECVLSLNDQIKDNKELINHAKLNIYEQNKKIEEENKKNKISI